MALAITVPTREELVQSITASYDRAAEQGVVDKYVAHILAADASFNQPAPDFLAPVANGETELDETDGTKTIAQAKEVFKAGIDGDFVRWGTDKPSKPSGKLKLKTWELVHDGSFKDFLVPPTGKTIDDLCIPQDKILEFCEKHPQLLRQDGCATLFLFKVEDSEATDEKERKKYFVASVFVRGRELHVGVYRFDDPYAWYADSRRRVVIPQLQGAQTL